MGIHYSKIYSFSKEELQSIVDSSVGYSDILRKIGLGSNGGNQKTLKRVISEYNIDESLLNKNRLDLKIKKNKCKRELSEILQKDVNYSSYKLLHRLYKEGIKKCRCERCLITEWQGQKISFQLHHIDGDKRNNELINLQVLCPNCHSLTKNFAGKGSKKLYKSYKKYYCIDCGAEISRGATRCHICNIKYKAMNSKHKVEISREELKNLICKYSFMQISRELGVSDNTVRKYCKWYDLPYSKIDVEKFREKEMKNNK